MNTLYVFDDLVVHSPGTVWDLRIFWQSTAGGVFSEASTAQFHKLSGTQEYFAGLRPWDRISAFFAPHPADIRQVCVFCLWTNFYPVMFHTTRWRVEGLRY